MNPHYAAAAAQTEAATTRKSPTTALILSICLGYLGADRLYIGHTGLGLLKMLTCGGAGIWWLIDLLLISSATDEVNRASARDAFHRRGLAY